MMKKVLSVMLAVLLCMSLTVLASALSFTTPFVLDQAGLLSTKEEADLTAKIREISQQYSTNLYVITVESLAGADIADYTEDLYDNGGYGYGDAKAGVMLLVDMDAREFRVFANNTPVVDYTDDIRDALGSYLSDGDYATAFEVFADQCAYYIDGELNGFPFDFVTTLIVSVVIGLIVGFIVVMILKSQLKSVRMQAQANDYVRQGSMKLTQSGDYYMYRTVTKVARQTSSSSSGSSRGGSTGRF